MNDTLDYMASSIRSAWSPPFRGEIYENAAKIDLQAGYAVKGPFDINTCRQLIGPLQAIRNPAIRLISARKAVQTLGSIIADITVPFWIEHDPGDILWLFEDDGKAKLYAETRAMPLIESIPEIRAMLEGVDRHDKTKTKIKFRHMNLVIAGMNLGNVQSISYRYVIIDEGWMHGSDGLMRQAKDRTKQYPDTKKIVLIGQAGIEDDDSDTEHKQTDQQELQYACPACRGLQRFELSLLRPDDFVVPQASAAALHLSQTESINLSHKLRGRYAGLSWDTNERTRPGGARWNYEEVGRTAHHRCCHCDHRIEDTPEVRRQLNDSFCYVATNPGAPSDTAGFWWPAEASTRIPFADLAIKYLRAKVASEELAYRLPLQEFYQKDRAIPWSETVEADYRQTAYEPYDVNSAWAEEAYRFLIVDCQRDLKKFHCGVFAVALDGESRELDRITLGSFQEIVDLQKKWKVRDQHTFLDVGYQMTAVLRECVKHGHVGQIKIGGKTRKLWRCWTGLKGSGFELFRHKNAKTELTEFKIYSERKFYNTNVGTKDRAPRAPWYEWSNLHCKDLLRARRDGEPGAPKFLTLPDTLPPTDQNSHFAQMRSEKRIEEYTSRGKRAIWKLIKETRPNHELDKVAMLIAVQALVGIIGSGETQDQPDS